MSFGEDLGFGRIIGSMRNPTRLGNEYSRNRVVSWVTFWVRVHMEKFNQPNVE